MDIPDAIKQPWSWYASGAAIAGVMVILIFFGKEFGFSSNLRTICAMCGAGKRVKFFDYDWRTETWNLLFLVGSVLGGFIAHQYLSTDQPVQISQSTIFDIQKLGFNPPSEIQPLELYGIGQLVNLKIVFLLILGGFFIGFGTRWAGGCTSGHAISGLSELQPQSLIAVIGFFTGGLIMTHVLFPFIF